MGLGVVGANFNRPAVSFQRFAGPVEFVEQIPEIVVRVRQVRL